MGDEEGGDAGLPLDAADLLPGLEPQPGVQIAEGFVQQQHPGPLHQCPGDGHPLLLAAGQLPGPPVHQSLDLYQGGGLLGPAAHLLPGGPVGSLQVLQGE